MTSSVGWIRRRWAPAIVVLLAFAGPAVLAPGCRTRQVEPPTLRSRVPMYGAPSGGVIPVPQVLAPPPSVRLPGPEINPWAPPVEARAWRYIVLHHTASESGDVESIDAEHRQRVDGNGNRWLGIGYHFVIGNGEGMGDGEIQPTFRWLQQLHGAHAGGDNPDYNQYGIGIVLVGNFEYHPPTVRQRESAARLVRTLARAYGITPERILAHRDVRSTECPGRFFPFEEIAGRPSSSLTYHSLRDGESAYGGNVVGDRTGRAEAARREGDRVTAAITNGAAPPGSSLLHATRSQGP